MSCVVFNRSKAHVFIVTKFHKDPEGGPGIPDTTYCISPGHGIDLDLLGFVLESKPPETINERNAGGRGYTGRTYKDENGNDILYEVVHENKILRRLSDEELKDRSQDYYQWNKHDRNDFREEIKLAFYHGYRAAEDRLLGKQNEI